MENVKWSVGKMVDGKVKYWIHNAEWSEYQSKSSGYDKDTAVFMRDRLEGDFIKPNPYV